MKQGYLTTLKLGRLGRFCNGAYQIAAVLGIAKKNNLEPVFPRWINHLHRDEFGSTEDVDLYKHFVHELPPIPEGIDWQPEIQIPWGYSDVRLPPGNWNLTGYFQSSKYFDDCRDQIQHYFRMKDEPPLNDYCAIHVRLGDYDDLYHPRLPLEYYEAAMLEFSQSQRFLVFSDDIPEAKRIFAARSNVQWEYLEYSEGRDYIADFKLLKTCRHFIVANSSYSAFAAVLGEAKDKKVVAPRPWFGPVYGGITGEDIYEPNWKVLDWQKGCDPKVLR